MADAKIEDLVAITSVATADVLAVVDDPSGSPATKQVTFENLTKRNIIVPCVMEVPEGTVVYPDVHAMTTTISKKLSGFVFPDGANAGTLNFKCIVPEDLHTTPNATLRFRFLTLAALTNLDVSLVVRAKGFATTEDADVAFDTDESEQILRMANANDTYTYYTQTLGGTFASGDTLHGQIDRRPADADDDYTGDILLVGIDLLIDVVGSA